MVSIYYLDLLWGLNVIIHLILFAGTARLMKRNIPKTRLWGVSLIGSCSIFIVLTPFEAWLVHPAGKIILSIILVYAAFGFPSLQVFVQSIFMFYVMSFLAAGLITALETMRFSLQHTQGFLSDYASSMYSSFSLMFIILAIPLVWMTITGTDHLTKKRKTQWNKLADVMVEVEDTFIYDKALVDTGNQLKDPVTRTPVMVMELSLLKKKIDAREFDRLYKMVSEKRMEDLENIEIWEGRWRIIPYRTAGADMQMMFALKPDSVTVEEERGTVRLESLLVGFEAGTLSSSGDFTMVLPSDPLEDATHVGA